MIKTKEQLRVTSSNNEAGQIKMHLSHLKDFDGFNPKVRMFAQVDLKPGEEVTYHVHEGEFESYYILSGTGEYNDNGEITNVAPGTVTFTPSGSGHGIKNIGNELLSFIALIVLD